MSIGVVIAFVVGLVLGLLVAWFYWRQQIGEREARIQRLQTSLGEGERNLQSSQMRLKEQEIDLSGAAADSLLKLVEAQFYRQRMYASCAFFFPELDSLAARYSIVNAAHVIKLTLDATGVDLSADFRQDISIAAGPSRESDRVVTGLEIFDEVYSDLEIGSRKRSS